MIECDVEALWIIGDSNLSMVIANKFILKFWEEFLEGISRGWPDFSGGNPGQSY